MYPGIRCQGWKGLAYHIKFHGASTIQSCNEACDSLDDCVAYVLKDDWSDGGCYLKNVTCLDNTTVQPGLSLFVKPSMYLLKCSWYSGVGNPSTSAKPAMTKLQSLFVALVNMNIFQMTLEFGLFSLD